MPQLQVQIEQTWGLPEAEQQRLEEETLALLRPGAREFGALWTGFPR
jgi:hypothetical protein